MRGRDFVYKSKNKDCRESIVSLGQEMKAKKLWFWGWGLCLFPSDPSSECPGMVAHTPNSSTHVLPNPLSALEGPWGQAWLHHSQVPGQNENAN